ncbi:MAG: hypothetical protein GY696_12170 [Gammaproteobacteria bacterium]|nr:hypothetical protein [Gammaproteobacteria bacterium]
MANTYKLLSFDMIAYVHEKQKPHWANRDFNAMRWQHVERFANRIRGCTEQDGWNEYF